MIDRDLFDSIKENYGDVASWAIWEDEGDKPASNMGLSILDLDKNPKLLETLNTKIIMVGLNFSISTKEYPKFHNFHCEDSVNQHITTIRNAAKIRHAFKDTKYWGAYMTDIIKNFVEVDSNKVKFDQEKINEHFEYFRKELNDIGAYTENEKPVIIAFGNAVYKLLKKNLDKNEYSKLIKVYHYSSYGGQEKYRQKVLEAIKE